MIGAVDIGGTKFAIGMFSRRGAVLSRTEFPTQPEKGREDGVRRIIQALRQTAAQAGEALEGIGIGCTGPVQPITGCLERNEFLPGWGGFNIVERLQDEFGVSAALENDADAAALGEYAWGAGRGARRFIYLTVSTGIGGGIVLDGKLYRGADDSHPEIGHHVIDPRGPLCFCGASGCWESLASGPALARRGKRASAAEVCAAALQGDEQALLAVEQEGVYLGIGLANLVSLFVPDVIALGGGVMQSRKLFDEKIASTIRTSCGLVPFEKTQMRSAELGRDAGLAGAAQVWLQRNPS